MEESPAWARCNSCKGDIDFEQTYYVCSVSTCNRRGTELRFCSVECWDAHVPVMRHREAWAEEKRSPSQAQWEREHPPAEEENEASVPVDAPASPLEPSSITLNEKDLPREILIVASKLKAYVRARSGLNTSDAVMEVLSDRMRSLCDEGIRRAAAAGRKTLMDRDFK
jgi:hypothetical protein